jgi:photosystem II stability/assembly factor-like uncharacterized protein
MGTPNNTIATYSSFFRFNPSIHFFVCFTALLLVFIQSPLCQSNWTQLNSPGGGNINNIFKVTDSIFIAGLQNGSLYRTSDFAATWTKVLNDTNPYEYYKGVRSFTFNSSNEIFIGRYGTGIVRSTNLGLDWIVTNCGGGEFMVNTKDGFMLSADNRINNWELAKSLDSGKTWISTPTPPWWTVIHSMSSFENIIYTGRGNNITFTADSSQTWLPYANNIAGSINIWSILIFSENEMLIGTDNGIYYTNDHGANWEIRNYGIPANANKIIQLQRSSDTIFACGEAGLFYTTDLGNQWIHYNDFSLRHLINSAVLSNDLIFAATKTGVYKIEQNDWKNYSNGIYEINPFLINSTHNNHLIYNTSSGLFKSSDNGEIWMTLEFDNFYGGCTFIHKGNRYFVQSVDSLFYLSTDYGANWSNTGSYWGYNTGMSFSLDDNRIYSGFYKSTRPHNPPYSGFRYSTNFGASWIYVPHAYDYDIFTKVVTIPGNIVLADIRDIITSTNVGLYRLELPIVNWIETNSGLPTVTNNFLTYDKFYDLYVSQYTGIYKLDKSEYTWHLFSGNNLNNIKYMSFNNNNHIIVISNGKIYASVNGNKWDYVSAELDSISLKIIEPDNNGYFYAADNRGRLYKTLIPHIINKLPSIPELVSPINNQQVIPDTVKLLWYSSSPLVMNYSVNLSSDSLFNNYLDTLVVDTSFTVYSLLSNQNYYWRVKAFNEIGWGEFSQTASFSTNVSNFSDPGITITEFALHQNYPNPFNPLTNIQYAVSSRQFVSLKVYDVLGNEIAKIVNEEKQAGSYEVEFNASGLASGIYFYELRVGSFVETKKMALMK